MGKKRKLTKAETQLILGLENGVGHPIDDVCEVITEQVLATLGRCIDEGHSFPPARLPQMSMEECGRLRIQKDIEVSVKCATCGYVKAHRVAIPKEVQAKIIAVLEELKALPSLLSTARLSEREVNTESQSDEQ